MRRARRAARRAARLSRLARSPWRPRPRWPARWRARSSFWRAWRGRSPRAARCAARRDTRARRWPWRPSLTLGASSRSASPRAARSRSRPPPSGRPSPGLVIALVPDPPRGAHAPRRRGALRARLHGRLRDLARRWAATRSGSARSSEARSPPASCRGADRGCWPRAAVPLLTGSGRHPSATSPPPAATRRSRRASTPRCCGSSTGRRAARSAPRSSPRRTTGRPTTWRRAIRWRAAGSASSTPATTPLFYRSALTPDHYRAWLDDNAVRFVALPDATLDYAARREAALLRNPPPYLRRVWSNDRWQVFAVVGARPLASGPATVADAGGGPLRPVVHAPRGRHAFGFASASTGR